MTRIKIKAPLLLCTASMYTCECVQCAPVKPAKYGCIKRSKQDY